MNSWIIAASCCLINFLVMGIARLAPLLFVASMERYNVNRAEASFPYVLCYVMRTLSVVIPFVVLLCYKSLEREKVGGLVFVLDCLTVVKLTDVCYHLWIILAGPLIGFVGSKFGLRAITLFGCILSFIGIGACYFAEDIIAVAILWGGVYGFGFGFGAALLPLILDRTFDSKNKTKANGIALAGSCLGAFVMPPIVQTSIIEYGLSGSFLIISGMMLHCVPISLLLSVSSSKNTNSTFEKNKESQQNGKLNSEKNGGQDINSNNEGKNMNSGNSLSNAIFKHAPESVKPPGTPILLQVSVISEHDYGSGMLSEPQKCVQNGGETNTRKEDKMHESAFRSFCIFVDPTFLLIMLSQSAYAFVVMVVWTIIVDVGRDKGVDRSSEVCFMMLLSLSDMIGRLSLGWITDGGYLSITNFCAVSFFLLGLFAVLFVWVYRFSMVLLTIFLFAYVSGGLIAVLPAVVCEFMDSRNKVMAMSSRMLLNAPLSLTTSPLIGYFREQQGSYDGIFYVVGGISILSCGMCALIPRFSRRSKS